MSDVRTYTGGCHCGRVRYEVKTDLKRVVSCNCSICTKLGALFAFVPSDQFKLLSGKDDLTDYQFGRKTIHHLFCRFCGIESFAMGTAPAGANMTAVNVRCLDDVDLAALTPTPFDGKSL
ncbi:MAG TPA: GFA family protein [Alphaproteobacteria bacterium]